MTKEYIYDRVFLLVLYQISWQVTKKIGQINNMKYCDRQANLGEIQMFHTDRGSEFNNKLIDDVMETFNIKRSLSLKGCPFDNAVAKSTFKIFKAEFVHGRNFASLERLKLELSDYINWFNNFRLHSSLGYLSPTELKAKTL